MVDRAEAEVRFRGRASARDLGGSRSDVSERGWVTVENAIKICRSPGDVFDYLTDITKIAGKAEEINIDLGKDYPLKVRFKIAQGHGEVSYMLAPRVESE